MNKKDEFFKFKEFAEENLFFVKENFEKIFPFFKFSQQEKEKFFSKIEKLSCNKAETYANFLSNYYYLFNRVLQKKETKFFLKFLISYPLTLHIFKNSKRLYYLLDYNKTKFFNILSKKRTDFLIKVIKLIKNKKQKRFYIFLLGLCKNKGVKNEI